ncbi:PREDICTED: ATP-dependent DNA helicase DDX11-like [Camelina sativa]|uniref:ATP-dependent DNA helicase DDX11-like n=1 Tax=Camelina sativa TaxID=90675 RepID=A0ABM0SY12_CAMSA|nr:PREDICTED: ATP-dependent DNA helicase DDX11-like [Camelina sativa]XP_010417780.1 PREDICTED: ATP-dependent DNA helicase DDX11-like [Camelina sativa]
MTTEKREFPAFPYKPYSIQIDFMNALYQFLDKGGVSMLESPTGTGKSLSIICSALQWLIDRKEKGFTQVSDTVDVNDDDDEPDWMRDFTPNDNDRANHKSFKSSFRLTKHAKEKVPLVSEGDVSVSKGDEALLNDQEFLLEEYQSEDESSSSGGRKSSKRKPAGGFDSSSEEDEEDDREDDQHGLKVFFCSRTHSQLSQFVKELRKTVFAKNINVVCLGSRKNLCINEDVLKLGNVTRINERCLELQKKKNSQVSSKKKNLGTNVRVGRTKASCRCPMLRKHKLQREFKAESFQQEAMDIEDLVQLGRQMRTCPYYGSRRMAPAADLVILPYQSLLSKSSRESLGLSLKNSVVIIDEAHNLADTLLSMHDAKITVSQLDDIHCSLESYLGRFQKLLGAGNRRYIQILLILTRALLKPFTSERNLNSVNVGLDTGNPSKSNPCGACSMAIYDFLFSLNIDNINLFKLLAYVKESNIIHKVSGYGERVAMLQKDPVAHEETSKLTSFRAFSDMLVALTNNNGDGRIIISRTSSSTSGQQGGYIKYVMLTGAKLFSEVVDEAHAVILAGGTLQPIEETRERLFPWLPSNQLQFFSCSHIVPPESIMPIAVSHGPSGQSFDFSHSSRSSTGMIQELGLLMSNLVAMVPEGVIVFFSSFEYETQVHTAWSNSGILRRIMKKKRVFREPRRNTEVEAVLRDYKEAIESERGAIMLAVVGGKVSEGINFSDSMCRCVVMVGLPYPSPSDFELLERIKHIEGLGDSESAKPSLSLVDDSYYSGDVQAGFGVLKSCKRRGKEYYENLCMKAVNQSIGRAIRHIKDYAAILLVDARYSSNDPSKRTSNPSNKLPKWIKDSLIYSTKGYGDVHRLLHQFFKHKNVEDSSETNQH